MILGTSASFYIYSKDDISDLFIINDLQRMFYFTLSQNEEGYLSPSIFIKSTEYNKTLVDSEINALSMLVMLMHPQILQLVIYNIIMAIFLILKKTNA